MAGSSLKATIAEVLQLDPSVLDDGSGMNITENWDSLNQFMITTALEREYGVRLVFSDLEEISTLQAIRGLLRSQNIEFDD